MNTPTPYDQLLPFAGAMAVLVGIPVVALLLVVRAMFKRRRALAAWRDCARRHGWSEGRGSALLSGTDAGIAWSLGVEGSEQDDLVWRGGRLDGAPAARLPNLAELAARAHAALPAAFRARLPLGALTVEMHADALTLSLRNRDLTCDDAAGLVRFGLTIAARLTVAGAP